jgi:DNA recombination protein RmuC
MDTTAIAIALITLAAGLLAGYLLGRSPVVTLRAELAHERRAGADRLAQAAAADRDLVERQHAIESLLAPMRSALDQVQDQLHTVERDRIGSYQALREQVAAMQESSRELTRETGQLVTALRAPQIRGRWGELQLEQIVRSAGMVEHCDFITQESVSTEDGVLRPDMVVRLAGGKNVVVDAKVSFIGFLEAMDAADDATRTARLKAHAKHVRTHIDQLGAKRYWQQFAPTPEFVVMFVPAEVFLNAALEQDPTLLEHAFDKNVVIATPATFVALLRTVAYTWRQEALASNADQIQRLGHELYSRLATMGGHLAQLGGQLDKAVHSYNSTVASLESRVLVTARKLSELGVSDHPLDAPEQITEATRRLTAPELLTPEPEPVLRLARDGRR